MISIAMKTNLFLTRMLVLTTLTAGSQGRVAVFLERNVIEAGQEAAVHVILPPRSKTMATAEVYWSSLPGGVHRESLGEKPVQRVYRAREPESGSYSISLVLYDKDEVVEQYHTTTLDVTPSRLGEKVENGLITFFGALLALVAYVAQRTYSAGHEQRRLRSEYRKTLCAVIDDIIARVKRGEPSVVVPETIANPGTSRWSEFIGEERYRQAISALKCACEWHNNHGLDSRTIYKLEMIKRCLKKRVVLELIRKNRSRDDVIVSEQDITS